MLTSAYLWIDECEEEYGVNRFLFQVIEFDSCFLSFICLQNPWGEEVRYCSLAHLDSLALDFFARGF